MRPKLGSIVSVALVLIFAWGLSGCAFLKLLRSDKLKEPEITYLRAEVKSVSADRALVDFVLNAKNPNKIGLKNVYVDYELFHEGRPFVRGDGLRLELAPAGDTEIRIPAVVAYGAVFQTVSEVTRRVIAGDRSIPVRIDAVIAGKPTLYNEHEEGSLFSFKHSFSRTEEIPLPEKRMNEATDSAKERAIEEFKKRF